MHSGQLMALVTAIIDGGGQPMAPLLTIPGSPKAPLSCSPMAQRAYSLRLRLLSSLTSITPGARIARALENRAGNSLIGFPNESLVFCPKMSE